MFNKKKKSYVIRIHLVTDNGQKAFYTIKIVFYSCCLKCFNTNMLYTTYLNNFKLK